MIIIAEAGVKHNGSIITAKKLVDVASDSGADYVKFQTFKTESLVTKKARKANYQINNTDSSETQFEMVKKLELDEEDHKELVFYCQRKGIKFLSTAFDLESIDLLKKLNISIYKIPSGEITNLPYLRKIGSLGSSVIMSTGMSTLDEVQDAMNILIKSGTKKQNITILHCNTEYPTPLRDVNLKAMITIKKKLGVAIGYSDHTVGIEVPIAAAALGATVIEKHFTLDKSYIGPDHAASLEPSELKAMVKYIRNIEQAMGSNIKKPSLSEKKNIKIVRKSIVAKKIIRKGELFSKDNLIIKRPGTGISPMKWDTLIGKKALKSYAEDDLI